jgi:hypothetical protein
MRIQRANVHRRRVLVSAVFLVLASLLWLQASVCAPDLHSAGHTHSSVAVSHALDHPVDIQGCHHDRHSHLPTYMLAAPARLASGGTDILLAVAAIMLPLAYGGAGATRTDRFWLTSRRRCRPGRTLLIDLCVART